MIIRYLAPWGYKLRLWIVVELSIPGLGRLEKPQALNPKPETVNPKPYLNPEKPTF